MTSPTSRLLLITEAPPAAASAGRFPSDQHPDAGSLQRASIRAAELPRSERAWCGPGMAARATAVGLGLDAEPVIALRDLAYGAWSGAALAEIGAADPERLAAWLKETSAAPPGGESADDLMRRVATWLEGTAATYRSCTVVASPPVVRAAVLHALGAPASCWFSLDVGFLTRSAVTWNYGRWRVARVNAPL